MQFTNEQNAVWNTLFRRQVHLLQKHGCSLFWEGFEKLGLPSDHIPSDEELNVKLIPATGWRVVRTDIRYSTADQWYPQFNTRHFPVTTFIRSRDELDFTPEPDVFHDTFGHLAYFMLPVFTAFAEIFAPAYLRAKTHNQKENIKRLAWFSYEFGVQLQEGKPKAFGAGLISSFGELTKVIRSQTQLIPFTVDTVLNRDKAVWSMHDTLFTFENLFSLQKEIESYLETV